MDLTLKRLTQIKFIIDSTAGKILPKPLTNFQNILDSNEPETTALLVNENKQKFVKAGITEGEFERLITIIRAKEGYSGYNTILEKSREDVQKNIPALLGKETKDKKIWLLGRAIFYDSYHSYPRETKLTRFKKEIDNITSNWANGIQTWAKHILPGFNCKTEKCNPQFIYGGYANIDQGYRAIILDQKYPRKVHVLALNPKFEYFTQTLALAIKKVHEFADSKQIKGFASVCFQPGLIEQSFDKIVITIDAEENDFKTMKSLAASFQENQFNNLTEQSFQKIKKGIGYVAGDEAKQFYHSPSRIGIPEDQLIEISEEYALKREVEDIKNHAQKNEAILGIDVTEDIDDPAWQWVIINDEKSASCLRFYFCIKANHFAKAVKELITLLKNSVDSKVLKGAIKFKFLQDPERFFKRKETLVLYVDTLSNLGLIPNLIQILSKLDQNWFEDVTPPGTQKVSKGIGYARDPFAFQNELAKNKLSFGTLITRVLAEATLEHIENEKKAYSEQDEPIISAYAVYRLIYVWRYNIHKFYRALDEVLASKVR